MAKLKISRKAPQAGDIFVFSFDENIYYFGRVVSTTAKQRAFTDIVIVYIYDIWSNDISTIPNLDKKRLLLPPIMTNRRPWTMGYFKTIANKKLEENDVFNVHCFFSNASQSYYDDNNNLLDKKYNPCGEYVLNSYMTIDMDVSKILGIE